MKSQANFQGHRVSGLFVLLCLVLALVACSGKSAPEVKEVGTATPVNPEQRQLAYGIVLTLPSTWQLPISLGPETTQKSLDTRRQAGERVLMLESMGNPSTRGLEPMVAFFLVNEEGTFMPRRYAERLSPEDFVGISKSVLDNEAAAPKNTIPTGLLDMQLSRESVDGKLAVSQRMLVAGPDGKAVRLMNWDIYMANGAGLAVKTVCDPEYPGAEDEIVKIVQSIHIQEPAAKVSR